MTVRFLRAIGRTDITVNSFICTTLQIQAEKDEEEEAPPKGAKSSAKQADEEDDEVLYAVTSVLDLGDPDAVRAQMVPDSLFVCRGQVMLSVVRALGSSLFLLCSQRVCERSKSGLYAIVPRSTRLSLKSDYRAAQDSF